MSGNSKQAYRNDGTIRILVVAPSLDILGGQAVQAARLTENLRREPGLRVGFLPVNPRLPSILRKIQKIRYVRTVVTSALYLTTLLARVWKYDVVHVFSASYLSFVLAPAPAIVIARLLGKKVLLNYRSGECEDHLRRWRTALPVIRLAHRVIVPSGYLVDVFSRFGIQAQAIANIVDLSRFAFRERHPLRPILLSNRNFESLYDVEAILRAFALLQVRVPHARLIVAGDGSRRDSLHRLAVDLDLKNVEFTGPVAPEQMHELHQQADIFVNASNVDNMPVSILEAFASGLAVVTTDAGGIPYIVTNERNGLTVSLGDWVRLARKVLALLENHELARRLISAAREDSEKYQWPAVRSEWLLAYREMMKAEVVSRFSFLVSRSSLRKTIEEAAAETQNAER
jgi:glycosyltransferase involved in cell wall biosynthesis